MNLLNYVAVFFLNYFKKIFWIYPFQQCILFFVSAIKNCTSSKPFNRKCVSNHNYLNHQYQELFYLVSLKPANVQFFFLRKKLLEYKRAWLAQVLFSRMFLFLAKKNSSSGSMFSFLKKTAHGQFIHDLNFHLFRR